MVVTTAPQLIIIHSSTFVLKLLPPDLQKNHVQVDKMANWFVVNSCSDVQKGWLRFCFYIRFVCYV